MANYPPFREIARQHAPLYPAFDKVQNGAKDAVHVDLPGLCLFPRPFQFRADQLELLPRYVAFVIVAECPHVCPPWGSSLTCHGDLEQPLRIY